VLMDQEDYEQAIYRFNKAREIDQGMVWDSYDVIMLRRKKKRTKESDDKMLMIMMMMIILSTPINYHHHHPHYYYYTHHDHYQHLQEIERLKKKYVKRKQLWNNRNRRITIRYWR
jgi:hypothetical protein